MCARVCRILPRCAVSRVYVLQSCSDRLVKPRQATQIETSEIVSQAGCVVLDCHTMSTGTVHTVVDEQIVDVISLAIADAARALRLSPQVVLDRIVENQTILLRALLHAARRYSLVARTEPPADDPVVIDDRPTPPIRRAPSAARATPLLPSGERDPNAREASPQGAQPRKPRG